MLPTSITDVFADAGLAAAVARRRPALVAMTLYVWNVARSLFLASNIKRHAPGTRVIVGGPEVTPDNAWVVHHPALDAGVFGEGESRHRPHGGGSDFPGLSGRGSRKLFPQQRARSGESASAGPLGLAFMPVPLPRWDHRTFHRRHNLSRNGSRVPVQVPLLLLPQGVSRRSIASEGISGEGPRLCVTTWIHPCGKSISWTLLSTHDRASGAYSLPWLGGEFARMSLFTPNCGPTCCLTKMCAS